MCGKRRMLLALMLCAAGVYAQSLGDVARQQKQKQQSKNTKPARKVITDEDMPSHPEESADSKNTSDSSASKDDHQESSEAVSSGKKSAEQWKSEIQAQKDNIASLQAQLENAKASIHFVEANRYVNGVEYNQYQLKKQQQADRMQKQLDSEKSKLENMQEAARRRGYGSAVYDP